MRLRTHLALAFLLGFSAVRVTAQSVQGVVVDPRSGEPVPGASVELLNPAGLTVDSARTTAKGQFWMQGPAPGRYTLRLERVGYATTTSPPIALRSDSIAEYRFEARTQAVSLAAIEVQEQSRCVVRPGSGPQTAALWDEARKALRGTAATYADDAYRFSVQTVSRRLDPGSRAVLSEESQTRAGITGSPFVPVPLDRLDRYGYVERSVRGLVYHAPDASTLLSDAFLDQHCFWVQGPPPGEPDLVGLAFEPVPGRRVPDVRGTLWLERATAELRRADYTYTRVPNPAHRDAGGTLSFRRLATGTWIVSRWRILMPSEVTQRMRAGGTFTRLGLTEQGGDVLSVRTAGGGVDQLTRPAVLAGTVFDSTRARPLANARVRLAGTDFSAATDAEGRFILPGLPEGAYDATFNSPRADSMGIVARRAHVQLRAGDTTRVALAIRAGDAPAIPLPALTARAPEERLRAVGFLERRAAGQGYFLTADEMKRFRTVLLSQVLREIPGVAVRRISIPEPSGRPSGLPPELRVVSTRAVARQDEFGRSRPCILPVYLDGRQILSADPVPQPDVDHTWVTELAGVEVYRQQREVPAQYRSAQTGCGLVLLWTKQP